MTYRETRVVTFHKSSERETRAMTFHTKSSEREGYAWVLRRYINPYPPHPHPPHPFKGRERRNYISSGCEKRREVIADTIPSLSSQSERAKTLVTGLVFIPNRTVLVRFGGISGEFGRAMVRI